MQVSLLQETVQNRVRRVLRSYHKQQVRKGFVLSYTFTTATTDFATPTYYIKRQHKPTRISATHVSTCAMHKELSASPGTRQGLCMTTDLLCQRDSLEAKKREFKSFRNTTLMAASCKLLVTSVMWMQKQKFFMRLCSLCNYSNKNRRQLVLLKKLIFPPEINVR